MVSGKNDRTTARSTATAVRMKAIDEPLLELVGVTIYNTRLSVRNVRRENRTMLVS